MEPVLLYITAANREEANTLARELVSERLIACANIVENVKSFYWWQGEVDEANELVVIAKTLKDKVERITERVKALHSYACPCIVSVPITGGNPEYLAWIASEVTKTS